MDGDAIRAVATAAGLGLAAVAIRASRKKEKTGREPWTKLDLSEYDYIIAGGQCLYRLTFRALRGIISFLV